MIRAIKKICRNLLKSGTSPKDYFLLYHYQRINHRRLEHLASLQLDNAGSTVLEVGAGIGDLTSFFLDRGCYVVSSDARKENLDILRSRYPDIKVVQLDLDELPDQHSINQLSGSSGFDIVFCYGTLYHLKNPAGAIELMASCCRKMLLMETCVSFGDEDSFHPCVEDALNSTQSSSGRGCRPTRRWVYNQLKRHFEFVYLPITQPNHEEFPIDWPLTPCDKQKLTRAVFIASRQKVINKLVVEGIPTKQIRY